MFRTFSVRVIRRGGEPQIQELYTEDYVLYVPPGTFVGHDAVDKFAGDLPATDPHFVYTPHGEPQVFAQLGTSGVGLGSER
jgi:hypothetical protein